MLTNLEAWTRRVLLASAEPPTTKLRLTAGISKSGMWRNSRSISAARSISLSVTGVLMAVVLLTQQHLAEAQQMPDMPLGTQLMQASEGALISKLLPSVVSANVAKDVKRPEAAMNDECLGDGRRRPTLFWKRLYD